MKTRHVLCGVLAGAMFMAAGVEAGPRVTVSADVADQAIEEVFQAGDFVQVTFYVNSEGQAAIFGVEFEAAVITPDVRIVSISFHPAFSRPLGRSETPLPGPRYRAVRVQPLNNVDRTLGADGAPIPFTTVELEVLNEANFASALEVRARCALVGALPETTTVLGVESASRASQPGRIEIVNARPAEEQDAVEADPWTYQEAGLALEVRPVGGGDPATVLAPYRTYELHYEAEYERVGFYVLFAVTTSVDQGFSAAVPPAGGDWSGAADFAFADIESLVGEAVIAPGYPNGYHRYQMVSEDFWPPTADRYAGGQGHLCNFTTGSAGELNLELYMDWTNPEAYHTVAMHGQAHFLVEEPAEDGDGAADEETP